MSQSAVAKQPILIKLTIPATLITKTAENESDMRQCIDRAFSLTLGRYNWEHPQVIIATLEQFGLFAALLNEKRLAHRLPIMNVNMFREDRKVVETIYNAVDKGMKPVHVDVLPIPPSTPCDGDVC